MSEHIIKRQNKNLLMYHLVLSLNYRRKALTASIGQILKAICQGIEERYEIILLEIGYGEDHVHFLVQSVSTNCVDEIIRVYEKHNSKRIIQAPSKGKGEVMRTQILDKWLLCKYSRSIW